MILSVRRLTPALLFALALPAAVHAAVYVPNKPADTNDGACDKDCSLREAIAAANQHPGEDVILLHAGTYTLTSPGPATGNLDIQGDLVLIGDGAGNTIIDGGGVDGIFHVAAGVTVQMQDVTLRNGKSPGAGGAINNNGDLTLLRTFLTGNSSVAGSAGAGLGGAIVSNGTGSTLTITDSTIANNSAQSSGGGLAAGGTVQLTNVTIAGNRSSDFGGGAYVFSNAVATLNNLTVANNSATLRGGGIFDENTPFIGVYPKFTNSILAGNTAANDPDCSGALDTDYALVGNATGCIGPSAANHDKVGTAASPVDARLGALDGGSGGPVPTLALLAGSPAIDAGNPSPPGSGAGACEATDQRGARRPAGATCDLGAFEATTQCVAGGGALCLNGERFKVTAHWQTANASGNAGAVTLTGSSGYFWFFDPENVEVTVKVIDGCASNGHFWVFVSGLTNVRVDLTVTDTVTGQVKTYTNPLRRTFRTILDSGAFACSYTEP